MRRIALPKGIEISGKSPFGTSSGVFEVTISITQSKPSEDSIANNSFNSLWQDGIHLRVSEGHFSQILGSDSKPIPVDVFELESVWIIIQDQFSAANTYFEFNISQARGSVSKPKPVISKGVKKARDSSRRGFSSDRGSPGERGYSGMRGEQGSRGITGDKGDRGDKGVPGSSGDKGLMGDKGEIGDRGTRGPPGPPGEKGTQGGMSEEGKKLFKELLELLASKNIISTEEQIKLASYLY